jgi:hypothetical protein
VCMHACMYMQCMFKCIYKCIYTIHPPVTLNLVGNISAGYAKIVVKGPQDMKKKGPANSTNHPAKVRKSHQKLVRLKVDVMTGLVCIEEER